MQYALVVTLDCHNPSESLPKVEELLRRIGYIDKRLSNAFYVSTSLPAERVHAAVRELLSVEDHVIVGQVELACAS